MKNQKSKIKYFIARAVWCLVVDVCLVAAGLLLLGVNKLLLSCVM